MNFFAISGCGAHLESKFSLKLLEIDQHNLRTKLYWITVAHFMSISSDFLFTVLHKVRVFNVINFSQTFIAWCLAGLLSQLLLASEVVRPEASVSRPMQAAGQAEAGGIHVDADLDARHLLPQREESALPRGDRVEPATASRPHRIPVVCQQVSIASIA